MTQASSHFPDQASLQTIALGEVVDVALDATVSNGGVYCEIGGDPAPCARFAIDAPRAGTLVIRMEFETPQSMFIYLYRHDPAILGGVVDLQNIASDRSPLLVRQVVQRGLVYLHAGLNIPWGVREGQVRFRLIASLE
jgi:hypothetical protein